MRQPPQQQAARTRRGERSGSRRRSAALPSRQCQMQSDMPRSVAKLYKEVVNASGQRSDSALGKRDGMKTAPIGDSGLEVAPLALGGNVFGWTADEATSFAMLDAFVDAGGTMIDTADVYSAWAPGHRAARARRSSAAGSKRSGKRDQVVIATKVGFMAGLAPETVAAACDASLAAARGRLHRPLLPAQGRSRACRWPTASARSTRWCRPARSAPSACRNFTAPAGRRGDGQRQRQWPDRAQRACRPGTIWSSARSSKAPLRDVATARRARRSFPYYSLANGFLTGKYRSARRSRQKPARPAQRRISRRARACSVLARARRASRPKPAPRSRRSHWPGRWRSRDHRADRQRNQHRASAANCWRR